MPRKGAGGGGDGPRGESAKSRKQQKDKLQKMKKEQELEDQTWIDNDKNTTKKQQRNLEKQQKQQEIADRKSELKKLEREELEQLAPKKAEKAQKATRASISEAMKIRAAEQEREAKKLAKLQQAYEDPLFEGNPNLANHLHNEEEDLLKAHSVDDALNILKRQASAEAKLSQMTYNDFENKRMPDLKADNPTLRMSQLRNMLKKEWLRSPLNPANSRFKA